MVVMKDNPGFDSSGFDEAAAEAEKELGELPKEAVEAIVKWWAKWYLKAGHKRLGRLMVKKAGGR